MTDTVTALRIDLNGRIREYDLTRDRREQYKVIMRALLDSAEVVEFIDRAAGPNIAVLARIHRSGQPLNPWAASASDALESQITQMVAGEVLFIGYLPGTDTITGLPEDAVALIREACARP